MAENNQGSSTRGNPRPRMKLGEILTNNYVWRSIFRHGYADTPRNRVLQVSANVWLHLHPSKMRRHGILSRELPPCLLWQ